MRHEACLPDNWWEFTVEHAVHLYNRTPVERLQWLTPFQEMHYAVPDISHLKVLGCGAYVYLPSDTRKDKLAPKSELMIYLGVAEGIKAHHFMCPSGCLFYSMLHKPSSMKSCFRSVKHKNLETLHVFRSR